MLRNDKEEIVAVDNVYAFESVGGMGCHINSNEQGGYRFAAMVDDVAPGACRQIFEGD
ncbi:MAG: hypothetical protein AAGG02_07775 [Cyanobacteria bacterium P01_H01_bin.15]